jgi:hypothetical protein
VKWKSPVFSADKMAPQVGLEPTTPRLTAGCSAIELLRSVVGALGYASNPFYTSIRMRVLKTSGVGF